MQYFCCTLWSSSVIINFVHFRLSPILTIIFAVTGLLYFHPGWTLFTAVTCQSAIFSQFVKLEKVIGFPRVSSCLVPAGQGLQQTTRGLGSDKTRGQGSFGSVHRWIRPNTYGGDKANLAILPRNLKKNGVNLACHNIFTAILNSCPAKACDGEYHCYSNGDELV